MRGEPCRGYVTLTQRARTDLERRKRRDLNGQVDPRRAVCIGNALDALAQPLELFFGAVVLPSLKLAQKIVQRQQSCVTSSHLTQA